MNNFTIKPNPNKEEYNEITEAVKVNNGYCPCELNKNDDTKCMCKAFKESTDTDFCHCGRFYKVENYPVLSVVCEVSGDGITKYINWYNTLTHIGFIVIPITFSIYDPRITTNEFLNVNRSKIAMSDAVLILDEENAPAIYDILLDIRTWTETLGKRIIRKEELGL